MSTAKRQSQQLQLAALSSAIAFEIGSAGATGDDEGWVQALPDGAFAAVDGRPHDVASGKWLMDSIAFAALQANTPHQAGDLVVDYEHQTLNKEKNGEPAPAAGWFSIRDVAYRPGEGLFIKPRFTDKALAFLAAKEYRYFSLVFGYDTATGRPQFIHSGALTNRPGVDGMLPLAELSARLAALGSGLPARLNAAGSGLPARLDAEGSGLPDSLPQVHPTPPNTEEKPVNDTLKKLLAKLGVSLEEGTELNEEQAAAALAALCALEAQAGEVAGLQTQLAALSANPPAMPVGQVDLSQYVPIATVNALRELLTALTAENGALTVEQTVKAAIDDGRAFACEKDYLEALGKQSMAALSANLDARKPLAALTAKQTTTVPAPKEQDTKLAALSAEEKQLANAWGMSEADFAKAKAADKE
ncbi:phage protease [Shewanella sp. 3B26]|uniref:Phage protease n=1 Tax=Shewanella zhuhaiensis TaxID=2919576 RepID=A0AAJ1BKR6_9GAMM|nr:phage protease [Shewanella zhuhaiensis]MCH4295574.1 phage protease [Shewanella zhuhaiensis]